MSPPTNKVVFYFTSDKGYGMKGLRLVCVILMLGWSSRVVHC